MRKNVLIPVVGFVFVLLVLGMALNGSLVLATAVTTTETSSCTCQGNSGGCLLTKALMDIGSWKASSIQINEYEDVNKLVMALKKSGYSPIDQYTKMYTTTPGIKVVVVPMASVCYAACLRICD